MSRLVLDGLLHHRQSSAATVVVEKIVVMEVMTAIVELDLISHQDRVYASLGQVIEQFGVIQKKIGPC